MSLWILIPAAVAAWFALGALLGLALGRVLARCSRAREAASDEEGQGS